jgi:hypothetical protein
MNIIIEGEPKDQKILSIPIAGYKAKAFEPRFLIFFFLIALGLMWIPSVIMLYSGVNLSSVTIGSVPFLIVITFTGLAGISPTLAAFIVTGITEGKSGVKTLLGRFWNRNLNIK